MAGNDFLESVPALSSLLPLVGEKQCCLPVNLSQTPAINIPQTRETHTTKGRSMLLERNVKKGVALGKIEKIPKDRYNIYLPLSFFFFSFSFGEGKEVMGQ